MEDVKRIKDVAARRQFDDSTMERGVLEDFRAWVQGCGVAGVGSKNDGRSGGAGNGDSDSNSPEMVVFYKDLTTAVSVECEQVLSEVGPFYRLYWPGYYGIYDFESVDEEPFAIKSVGAGVCKEEDECFDPVAPSDKNNPSRDIVSVLKPRVVGL